jgi:glycosyltransferase involved in cell wall biosynthesis
MIGFDPTEPEGFPLPEGMRTARSQAKIDAWKRVAFRHIPWVDPESYGRPALPLDIGLCPLRDNDHTRGKSDVKAVEYAISGAAVIAQDTPVYNRTLVHGETALLVRDQREMLHAVDILLNDEALRMRLVNNLRRYVAAERNENALRREWGAALA